MSHNKIQLPIEFDPYKNYQHQTIEELPSEKWRELAVELFDETPEKRSKGIEALKKKAHEVNMRMPQFSDNPDEASEIEDKFWLMVLRSGGMNAEAGFKVLSNYLNMQKQYPLYFALSNPPHKLDFVYQEKIHAMLQHRDQNGRRVYMFRPGRWNPDKVHFNDLFCAGYALTELVSLETKTQIAGVTAVADALGFGFKQFRQFTVDHARSATAFIQDSFPLWFRSIHVVNAPRLFILAFSIVKPFLNERVKNSIFFHDSFESLHEHVPKEILPEDLGGLTGPFDNFPSSHAVYDMEKHFALVQAFVAANKHLNL